MKHNLIFFILVVSSTISYSQQNFVLNLSSSLNFEQPKTLLDLPLNTTTPLRKESLALPLRNKPNSNFYMSDSRFNSQKNWTLNRKEIRFGIGATQFLGDLGGKDQIGTDYSLKDLDWTSTNFMLMAGYRYRFSEKFATTTSLVFGIVKGSDALTKEKYRSARNLQFKAPILEITQRLDVILFQNEKVGKRYNIKGLHGFKNRNEQVYVFAGVGLVSFTPKALYDGKWYRLRPLSTEGQGLAGGTKKYLPVTVVVPIGLGFRVGINREWRVGMEVSYIKTFSDYIDDVHGTYYDKSLLAQQKGPVAAALSDRSDKNNPIQQNWFGTGQQRGDKQNDAYFYVNVVISKNITYKNYTKTYRKHKLSKGKYKF